MDDNRDRVLEVIENLNEDLREVVSDDEEAEEPFEEEEPSEDEEEEEDPEEEPFEEEEPIGEGVGNPEELIGNNGPEWYRVGLEEAPPLQDDFTPLKIVQFPSSNRRIEPDDGRFNRMHRELLRTIPKCRLAQRESMLMRNELDLIHRENVTL